MLNAKLVNCSRLLNHNHLLKKIIKNASASTQPAVQSTQEHYERQLKDFETLSNITRKVRVKKPQKPPFAKNLCIGVFDTDILTYPQLEKEDIASLEQNVLPVDKLVKQNHIVDCDSISNKHFRQNLSDYKAIGLQASQFMDGRECNLSESSRFLEALTEHNLASGILYNEQLGVQTLVKFANDELKKKYLHALMTGESLSAFCMTEVGFSDFGSMKTKATLSADQKTWVLNGEKAWVVNGISADVLIVFALTEVVMKDHIQDARLTAFIVDRDSTGLSYNKIDCNGVEVSNIVFSSTLVPVENVIGEVNNAEKILSSILTEFRLSSGTACITLTKNILNRLSEHILEQSNDFNLLNQTDAIRGKIGELSTSLYAMESVVYLTTGLIDSYENQDCELENTIVKVFCSDNCLKASTTCLDLIGAAAISDSHWASRLHRESVRYVTLHETNDGLKMIIALLGLQYAGINLNEKINKLRNPLFHAGYIFKRMWTNRKNNEDDPKLSLELGDYLHPSLFIASQHLEYCVKRLEFGTEILLARYGPEVVKEHMDLRRFADSLIDIYAMTACVGRASRSYCIGLQHSDYEMLIASAFCAAARERVKYNIHKIFAGELHTNDKNYNAIAKRLFETKGYFLKHPLARNF